MFSSILGAYLCMGQVLFHVFPDVFLCTLGFSIARVFWGHSYVSSASGTPRCNTAVLWVWCTDTRLCWHRPPLRYPSVAPDSSMDLSLRLSRIAYRSVFAFLFHFCFDPLSMLRISFFRTYRPQSEFLFGMSALLNV